MSITHKKSRGNRTTCEKSLRFKYEKWLRGGKNLRLIECRRWFYESLSESCRRRFSSAAVKKKEKTQKFIVFLITITRGEFFPALLGYSPLYIGEITQIRYAPLHFILALSSHLLRVGLCSHDNHSFQDTWQHRERWIHAHQTNHIDTMDSKSTRSSIKTRALKDL